MKNSMHARTVEYVHANPGATAAEVAIGIDAHYASVSVALNRQEQRGAIVSETVYGEGPKGKLRRFYPPVRGHEHLAVIRRAQAFDGPFRILIAQLDQRPLY